MNKAKTKNGVNKIGKYLRELSVVVAGIAITLMASNWLSSNNEKKDLQLYLNAVKLEQEENLGLLNSRKEHLARACQYTKYLTSKSPKISADNPNCVHPDTLDNYAEINNNIYYFIYKSSAFEMFKISGMMRFMEDKALLKSLWDRYADLEALKIVNDNLYTAFKIEDTKLYMKKSFAEKDTTVPLYDFFANLRMAVVTYQAFNDVADSTKQFLLQLEKQ